MFEVQVRARNAQGWSGWSTSSTATPAAVPGKPSSLVLTAGNNQICASWSAPTEETDMRRYYIIEYSYRPRKPDARMEYDSAVMSIDADLYRTINDAISAIEQHPDKLIETKFRSAASKKWDDREVVEVSVDLVKYFSYEKS